MTSPNPAHNSGLKGAPVALRLPCDVVGDLIDLLDQPVLCNVATQLHIRPMCPGLQACMSHLGRSFLVKDGFFENCDIFLLGGNLFHDLTERIRGGEAGVCSSELNSRDFPGGAVVENLPANAGDTGSSPGPGRSHMPWSN